MEFPRKPGHGPTKICQILSGYQASFWRKKFVKKRKNSKFSLPHPCSKRLFSKNCWFFAKCYEGVLDRWFGHIILKLEVDPHNYVPRKKVQSRKSCPSYLRENLSRVNEGQSTHLIPAIFVKIGQTMAERWRSKPKKWDLATYFVFAVFDPLDLCG